MITHPKADELTKAVAAWIDEIRPQLDPRNAFLARVAANALMAVTRELEQGPAADAQEARLLADLGATDVADLCAKIEAGDLTVDTPGLIPALKQMALTQLAIDQPSYKHEAITPPARG